MANLVFWLERVPIAEIIVKLKSGDVSFYAIEYKELHKS
jgi:hypothetical protein